MQSVTNQIKMANGSEYATAINELRGNTNLDPHNLERKLTGTIKF